MTKKSESDDLVAAVRNKMCGTAPVEVKMTTPKVAKKTMMARREAQLLEKLRETRPQWSMSEATVRRGASARVAARVWARVRGYPKWQQIFRNENQ